MEPAVIVLLVGAGIFIGAPVLFLLIHSIVEAIDDKYLDNGGWDKIEEKGKKKSKKVKGVYIYKKRGIEFCFQDGKRVCNKPIYKKPDNTYCTYDAPTHKFYFWCSNGKLETRYIIDKNGKRCARIDEHGNEIVQKNIVRSTRRAEENYSTSSGSSYRQDNSYDPQAVQMTVDWRADGSYGENYNVGGIATDEWGNPL